MKTQLGGYCSPHQTIAHHTSPRWDGTQVVLWLRRSQDCRFTLALPSAALSPFEMHIHGLNACSASGKSVPTRVTRTPFFPESDFNCAVLSKFARSHVARTLLFMPMSKAITAASPKQTIPSRRSHPVIWNAKSDGREYKVALICMCMNDT